MKRLRPFFILPSILFGFAAALGSASELKLSGDQKTQLRLRGRVPASVSMEAKESEIRMNFNDSSGVEVKQTYIDEHIKVEVIKK